MKTHFFPFLIVIVLPTLCACNHFTRGHSKPMVLNLPHHTIRPTDTAGTVIYTRLTNTTGHSITLHPLLTPMQATDSASLIQGFLTQLISTRNTDSIRLQLIQIVGHYIKSPYKTSFLPYIKDNNNKLLIQKEYSFIGSGFSIPAWHCANFCKEAIYLLESTGYFADSDFIIQNCRIHTAMQVKLLNGDTIYVDMATGTPVFMVPNPAKRCQWASFNDLLKNTDLITSQARYYYKSKEAGVVDVSPERSISNYKLIFGLPWKMHRYGASNFRLYNFTGDFVLAPGQSLEFRDTLGYVIDTTINARGSMINAAMQKVADFGVTGTINSNPALIDSAMYYLYAPYAHILNIPIQQAEALFNYGKFILYSNRSNWTPSYVSGQSVLYSSIPASDETIYYGIQTSLPLLITSSSYKTNGVVTGTFGASFFANALFCPALSVSDTQFNYANGIGKFTQIPPHTAVQQTLLYNYNVFDFYTGGAMFLASDSGIQVQSSADVKR